MSGSGRKKDTPLRTITEVYAEMFGVEERREEPNVVPEPTLVETLRSDKPYVGSNPIITPEWLYAVYEATGPDMFLLGIAVALALVLPEGEGVVSSRAISRVCATDLKNTHIKLRTLSGFGIIDYHPQGRNGTFIRFRRDIPYVGGNTTLGFTLRSNYSSSSFFKDSQDSKETTTTVVETSGDDLRRVRHYGLALAALACKSDPCRISAQAVSMMDKMNDDEACACVMELLPHAKGPFANYLHGSFARGWTASPLAVTSARREVEKWGVLLNDGGDVDEWRKLHKSMTGYTMGDDAVLSWRQEKLSQIKHFVQSIDADTV